MHMYGRIDRWIDGSRCWCEAPPWKTARSAVRWRRGALPVDPSACGASSSSRELKNTRLRIFLGTWHSPNVRLMLTRFLAWHLPMLALGAFLAPRLAQEAPRSPRRWPRQPPRLILEPFWLHFSEKNRWQNYAHVNAEKVMKIDEPMRTWNKLLILFEKYLHGKRIYRKGWMYGSHLNPAVEYVSARVRPKNENQKNEKNTL